MSTFVLASLVTRSWWCGLLLLCCNEGNLRSDHKHKLCNFVTSPILMSSMFSSLSGTSGDMQTGGNCNNTDISTAAAARAALQDFFVKLLGKTKTFACTQSNNHRITFLFQFKKSLLLLLRRLLIAATCTCHYCYHYCDC